MNLAQKFQNSWELMKTSLRVIRDNPRLALFPIVSFFGTPVLVLFFMAPILVMMAAKFQGGAAWMDAQVWLAARDAALQQPFRWVFYSYGAVIYLVSLFAAAFFNVALYHEILRALAGERVSLKNGLRFASGRLGSILMWSLLAGTVGLIIRWIEDRLGWFGKITMGLIGIAWSVASVFAIPVIVRHDEKNPFTVLRASALTLKATWGESLVGFVGMQAVGLAFMFFVIVFGVIEAVTIAVLQQVPLAVAMGGLFVVAMMLYGFVMGLASHVYRCALYVFASEGVVPQPYTRAMMDTGWKIKKV